MNKNDFELARWIDGRADFNVFATVTFKQALAFNSGSLIRNARERECVTCCVRHALAFNSGTLIRNTVENVDATCSVIRDRVFKKLKRSKTPFPWITTIENGGGEKRLHAHMAMQLPRDIEFCAFHDAFHDICGRMDWVHDRVEVTPIVDQNGERGSKKIIFYMLKEGADALALNASSLRFQSAGR